MGNYVINNSLSGEKSNAMIKLLDTSSNHIISNNMTFSNLENVVIIKNSKDNEIAHNNMSGIADKVVYSVDSGYTNFNHNNLTIRGDSVFGYYAYNSAYDSIKYNDIIITGNSSVTNQSAVLFTGKSVSNTVAHNNIFSYSLKGDDYAVMIITNENLFNKVINN